jgi:UrcA family protein
MAICLAACGTVIALGLVLASGAAAQDGSQQTPEVSRQSVGRDYQGAPIDLVTVVGRVSSDDLNLARTADAAELHARVEAAARAVCRQLRRTVPFEDVDLLSCVRQATEQAATRASVIVAQK